MPTLYATGSWKITMYFHDHSPPHFRILTKDHREVQIRIVDFTVMAGGVPAATLRAALAWAAAHKPVLSAQWEELHPR